ncbi:uncharacterized protein [Aristolochia californica]|uniref:uncharacterized protein n=1 Tax=Aristolochia californica TaxID=171875 RepID=UPI0035DBF305
MATLPRILELERDSKSSEVIEEIVKMEKKIFPKHESLAKFFHEELRKKNAGLMYLNLGGEVVGYVMYSWPSSLFASITKLAVKENHRRQGHGESLLRAAIEKCRGRKIQRICLHVDPSRGSALSLYQKLGFQIDKLVECYYSVNRHAYRMFLDFDQ